jgi:hypothetical protein
VVSSVEKLVSAREVLAAGPQPQPTMETVIITLMHIAFYSEKVELEVSVIPFHFYFFIRALFSFFHFPFSFKHIRYVRQRTKSPLKRKTKGTVIRK